MPCILDITTAVPEFQVSSEAMVDFYSQTFAASGMDPAAKKLALFSAKTKIKNRYSCIPDFNGDKYELFTNGDYIPTVEKRTAIYKEKIMPLACRAIDKLLLQTNINHKEVTHLITVTCTGVYAPGLEFSVSEYYGLQHTEKLALNFLGCYAAIKALKHAHYIALADPNACILIICAELCSLHFYPTITSEEIVANLLFADGAAAAIVCGNESSLIKNKVVLNIDSIGSAYIPNTLNLMTWDISSAAFKMHLSKDIVIAIKENIKEVVNDFLGNDPADTDYWAIHPGGVRVVDAVKESLQLSDENVEDSMHILHEYGNMSSPTILFILSRIFDRTKNMSLDNYKKIFTCAFGPGLSIEMINLIVVNMAQLNRETHNSKKYAVQM